MSPNDVIEAYVRDVARNLPGKMRFEVAQDLRIQLADELAGRAAESGRGPDETLALELTRGMGRPEDLAARYHQPFAIIDPADTHRFIVILIVGYGMVATVAVTLRRLGVDSFTDLRFGGLAWIGLMTIVFGIRNWLRTRKPEQNQWRPRRRCIDLDRVNYPLLAISALLTVFMLLAYIWPGQVVQLLSGGRVDAATFAYAPHFSDPRYLRFPWLIGVFVAFLGLYAVVAVRGRWSRTTRWLYIIFLFHLALQLGWHMAYPAPVFQSPDAERMAFPIYSIIILVVGIELWLRVLREWDWIEPPKAARAA